MLKCSCKFFLRIKNDNMNDFFLPADLLQYKESQSLLLVLGSDAGVLVGDVDVQLGGSLDDFLKRASLRF